MPTPARATPITAIPKGDPELIAAIRRAWKEDFGQDVSEDEVLVTTSSCIGMSQALMGILNPGDEVIVFGPYFADYASQAALAGGRDGRGDHPRGRRLSPARGCAFAARSRRKRAR